VDTTRYETFWRHVSALPVRKPSSASFSTRNGLVNHREGLHTIDALWASARRSQRSWNPAPVAAAAAPAAPAEAAAAARTNFVELSVYMGPWSDPSVKVTFERA
jgi:hypothetical protein